MTPTECRSYHVWVSVRKSHYWFTDYYKAEQLLLCFTLFISLTFKKAKPWEQSCVRVGDESGLKVAARLWLKLEVMLVPQPLPLTTYFLLLSSASSGYFRAVLCGRWRVAVQRKGRKFQPSQAEQKPTLETPNGSSK